MRSFIVRVLLIALIAFSARADDSATRKVVKEKVQEMNDALLKEDFGKVADLTHARVVEQMGGRDKMVAVMAADVTEMKSRGFGLKSVKVEEPSDVVLAGAESYVVVAFQLVMKVPGGKETSKSFVIGVSPDAGKTWTFINGDLDIKVVKEVLPNLPDSLKLPEKQKPVFEKD